MRLDLTQRQFGATAFGGGHSAESCAASIRRLLVSPLRSASCSPSTMTVGHLLFSVAMTRYILIGIQLQERYLIQQFGDQCRRYSQRAAMLVPLPGRKFRPRP
jgi:protein-S-isoprenylcysteine O-methyltransferase Ste14